MAPEFELNHLKYFYFTVLEGGVSPAAERLSVQQPVVSKMLASLEDRLGQCLFRKSGRRKVLTDFGQLVYRHCQTVFQELDKLQDIKKGNAQLSGAFSFGCSEVMAGEKLAEILKSLVEKHPQLHPNLYTSTASHLIELITRRKLELGLFFHLPELPANLEIYRRIPLRFHLVVAAKQRKNAEVIARFIGSREIDDTSTHRFPTLERLRRDYKQTSIALSSNHLGFHRQLVLQGFGSAILPRFLIEADLRSKKLVDIYPRENFMFDLKIVTPKGEVLSKAALLLIEQLTEKLSAN